MSARSGGTPSSSALSIDGGRLLKPSDVKRIPGGKVPFGKLLRERDGGISASSASLIPSTISRIESPSISSDIRSLNIDTNSSLDTGTSSSSPVSS